MSQADQALVDTLLTTLGNAYAPTLTTQSPR